MLEDLHRCDIEVPVILPLDGFSVILPLAVSRKSSKLQCESFIVWSTENKLISNVTVACHVSVALIFVFSMTCNVSLMIRS